MIENPMGLFESLLDREQESKDSVTDNGEEVSQVC